VICGPGLGLSPLGLFLSALLCDASGYANSNAQPLADLISLHPISASELSLAVPGTTKRGSDFHVPKPAIVTVAKTFRRKLC
jgi:hypothetical protein